MKKVLSIVFLVAAMLFAANANAQIKFGLKGGLNVTSMSFSEEVFDASNKTGRSEEHTSEAAVHQYSCERALRIRLEQFG